jgi:hypothetical protein
MEMGQGPVSTGDDDPTAGTGREEFVAAGLGLLAMAIACVPPALFVLAPDDGRRGAWMFADARNWTALRWFGLASIVGLGPVYVLARMARDRARRWPARLIAGFAIALGLPMIPGAVMQIAWWTSR